MYFVFSDVTKEREVKLIHLQIIFYPSGGNLKVMLIGFERNNLQSRAMGSK